MTEMNLIISAPGKVILHGEHAVVYGKSAIAASLNLRSYVQLVKTGDGRVGVDLPAVGLRHSWNVDDILKIIKQNNVDIQNPHKHQEDLVNCIKETLCTDLMDTQLQASVAFLYLYISICSSGSCPPSINVKITSKLPVGAGLGSSASFSVCLVAALLLVQGHVSFPAQDEKGDTQWKDEDLELINKWAYEGERIMHGTPSGIDNSVATFGGAIKFQAGKITKLNNFPRLKILLSSTNVPRSTKVLVGNVRERYNRVPDVMQHVMDATEAVTHQCEKILETMATESQHEITSLYTNLEELIDINQHLLQAMGVSHVTLDKICHVTSKYRLHSKLTGAGGGGCAFTLLRPEQEQSLVDDVIKELEMEGFNCFITDVGSFGVMVHDSLPESVS
ncbi:mevalonate kinase-like [Ruditapes philippinarum]|uniref:mevalonate kinase-like n=1 Tax=Ruditapes philippinarum TaxID=129788 RepID=UPI00295B2DA9|nr:mevalonate kinase-like [Ruditapes philippinarum]